MTVKMDARSVAKIKPQAQRMEYFDADCPGLALRVSPSGVKSWVCFYRIGKRLRRWTIGNYSTIGLADARTKARNAIRKVPDGIDPALKKKERREAGSFGELAEWYIEEYAKPRKRTWRDDNRLLNNEVLPSWRHRPARDITRADVREIIEAVAARPAPILANRLRALLHRLFTWAIEQEHVDGNPVAYVRRPGVEKQRDRVLTEDEIRTLWKALDKQEAHMAAAFKLRLITAQRGGEVADMRWADVDLEAGWWTIPGERAKNGLPHRVPLTAMAVEIVKALKPAEKTARGSDTSKKQQHIRAAAQPDAEKAAPVYVLAGARGKRQRSEAAATFGLENFIGHDLRRTAASMMAAGGVSRFIIGRVLNHVEKGVTAVYDRHSYDAEKQAALTWWDAKLTAILEKRSSKVLSFIAKVRESA
jgi:integrase